MGAGASATGKEGKSEIHVQSRDLSSRSAQGTKLGPEYDVVLKGPALVGLEVHKPYTLRVAYEALVVLDRDTQDALTYFKYQDILCWGSTNSLFQFKVFGGLFGRDKNDLVAIMFDTKQGKELERITLESVKMLMQDMTMGAVSKDDFNVLKGLLATTGRGADDAAAASGGGGDWFTTVKQFAASRQYTSHQGTEIVKLAMNKSLDDFELIDLSMFLWKNMLNRDSFQLILNLFRERSVRENIIQRIKVESPKDPSAMILQPDCSDAGGGLQGQGLGGFSGPLVPRPAPPALARPGGAEAGPRSSSVRQVAQSDGVDGQAGKPAVASLRVPQ